MEIKVKCICGSIYLFEEVPVHGRLAFPVSCTNCGADGTENANQFIARKLAGEPEVDEKAKRGLGLFGLGRRKDKDDRSEEANSSPEADEAGDEASMLRIFLAMTGVGVVGAIGAFCWLQLAKATGFEFGYAAWAIGGLVGGASRLFAPRGHYWLGPTAALAAFLSIGGGQVLVTKWLVDVEVRKALPLAFEETRRYAKDAVEAASDDEIRECLAQYKIPSSNSDFERTGAPGAAHNRQLFELGWALYGIVEPDPKAAPRFAPLACASNPKKITAAEITHFKEKELPELKAFLNGKPSQQEYESTLKQMVYSKISINNLVAQSIRPNTILWLALGLGTAFKLAQNAGLSY
jgi:hypothetical protein